MRDRAEGEQLRDLGWGLVGALVALVGFALLATLLLWPLGKVSLLWPIVRALGLLLVLSFGVNLVTGTLSRLLRWNIYDRSEWFVGLGVLASGLLMVAWAVHVSRLVELAARGMGGWGWVALFLVGLLSLIPASQLVGLFYHGQIYRLASLGLGLVGYVGWAAWSRWVP